MSEDITKSEESLEEEIEEKAVKKAYVSDDSEDFDNDADIIDSDSDSEDDEQSERRPMGGDRRPMGGDRRPQNRDRNGGGGGGRGGRKFFYTKKVCKFSTGQIDPKMINYKNIDLLRKYVMPSGKIVPRRITGTAAKYQRRLAAEIKKARVIALLPFVDR